MPIKITRKSTVYHKILNNKIQIFEILQVDELGVATKWTYGIAESAAFAV